MESLAIGKIAKPFGVHGWLKVQSYSGEVDHFLMLSTVQAKAEGRECLLRIEKIEAHDPGLIIKFAGYDSPETAKALSGLELWVPRDKAAACGPGEYYFADLVGCSLVHDGQVVARVEGVLEGGPTGYLLEAHRGGETPVLVAFEAPFIGKVDLTAKTIELLTPWVLD